MHSVPVPLLSRWLSFSVGISQTWKGWLAGAAGCPDNVPVKYRNINDVVTINTSLSLLLLLLLQRQYSADIIFLKLCDSIVSRLTSLTEPTATWMRICRGRPAGPETLGPAAWVGRWSSWPSAGWEETDRGRGGPSALTFLCKIHLDVCFGSYVSFAKSVLWISLSRFVAALRKLATACFKGSGTRHKRALHPLVEISPPSTRLSLQVGDVSKVCLSLRPLEPSYLLRCFYPAAVADTASRRRQGSPAESRRSRCSSRATPGCQPVGSGRFPLSWQLPGDWRTLVQRETGRKWLRNAVLTIEGAAFSKGQVCKDWHGSSVNDRMTNILLTWIDILWGVVEGVISCMVCWINASICFTLCKGNINVTPG